MSATDLSRETKEFLAGGGEMGELMRAKDWSRTPLGPVETWSQSLRTAVRIMLTSRFQMWIGWGPELVFLYNDAYRPTLGVKHRRALGTPTAELWPEIWNDIGPLIADVIRTGNATWNEELMLLLERSGFPEETYHTFSYSPLSDDSGATVGMLSVVMEETDRVIGERRIALLRDLSADLASTISQDEIFAAVERRAGTAPKDLPFTLIYLFDADGEQARLACATGFTGGQHPLAPTVIGPDERKPPWPVAELLLRGAPVMVDGLATRSGMALPTGAWDKPPNQAIVVPIKAQGQERPAGLLVVGISPYRRYDADYSGFVDLLAGQIAAALANARAYQEERKRAEALSEIDRAKTAFFSNVSHEFRTPLALMLGPLEELLARPDGADPDLTRTLAGTAHRNSMRLLKLVNSLLDFSRIEAGRVQATYEPTDLAAFTAELASSFRSAVERAGLRLEVDCPPLPEPVYVDRDMWEKIVLNLLSNAFKFTFDGAIAVEVRPSADGRAAALAVRDTGTGIPAHELPRLFERFHRIEGARGRSVEGSGIGLALVQELVKLHGGTITVESELDRGSAFTVTIPIGTAHLSPDHVGGEAKAVSTSVRAQAYVEEALRWLPGQEDGEASESDMTSRSAADDLGTPGIVREDAGARIVLADDNADMRNYVRRLLLGQGYEVEAVANGEAALAAARRQAPGLVLSDVMMPRLDGFGLLRALRDDPALRDVPVVLLSARAGEEARVEGLDAGADDYLTKPFSARELLARVRVNIELARVRRQATAEIRRSEERFRAYVTASADVVYRMSPDWSEMRHLEGKDFIADTHEPSSTWLDKYIHPDDQPRVMAAINEAIRTKSIFELEHRVRRVDGSLGWTLSRAIPLLDERGEIAEWFGAAADITARKEAEAKLEDLNTALEQRIEERTHELVESERRFGLLVQSVVDYAIFMLDRHGRVASWNAGAERIKGYRPVDIIGQHFSRFYTEEDRRAGIPQRALATAQSEGRFEAEGWRVRKDGSRFWANVVIDAIRDEAGQLIGFAKVTRDITERKRAQEALEATREQLRQAQKMEAIGQLTGGVAHDFNNLLQVIMGNLEALERGLPRLRDPGAERLLQPVQAALHGADRAAALTQRLLAFARRQPLAPEPLDPNKLVGSMSDLLRRTLGESIAIETVLAGGLWRSFADPNQVESALLNLAVNARDAMPEGGKLTIETANTYLDEIYADSHHEVTPGQYVMIAVTDTGIGMSKEIAERVFEPFFTTKEPGRGTGLGLSQVYGFIKQSGGHVKIYSEPGTGTTVRIYLPRYMPKGNEQVESSAASSTIPTAESGETILVVEDDDDVRESSVSSLRELGYRVLEASDGIEALHLLERAPAVRLLFTDVGLPGGMNGRKLADEALRRRPDLRVLFTTGYARNAVVHHGRLDPGVELLVKPYTYATLAAKIRAVLGPANDD